MSYLHRMQALNKDSLNSVNYECNNDRRTKHADPSTIRGRPVKKLDRTIFKPAWLNYSCNLLLYVVGYSIWYSRVSWPSGSNLTRVTKMSLVQACPWEWDSHGNPMGNVPWDGMGWDSTNCNSHGIENLLNEHSDSEYEYQ
ncbi:unnamed protein product [Clavelina lepadiformis]|uniref:Uncharacterized protein n=1 Tax=Clavelina lepadiformis TaxID=159417 RepID=A0ABP0GF72_CLALP